MVVHNVDNAALASQPTPTPAPTKRLRWAAQYMKEKSASLKRLPITNRLRYRGSHRSENKRDSGEANNLQQNASQDAEQTLDSGEEGRRQVHFNIPLPPDALDDNGNPRKSYGSNKVRTAKYTPLSFIPKNLWFQFHSIANIYFFILIMFTVS